MQKTFTGEFEKFKQKLQEKENFALSRFSDGETFILKGQTVVLDNTFYITGNKTGAGSYLEEEFKEFYPERDSKNREALIDAFKHRQPGYYKGLTGKADEDIAGEGIFKYQLDLYGTGDDEHLTFSNVFINNNYPRFLSEIVPLFKDREVYLIASEKADIRGLQFRLPNIQMLATVGRNCFINDTHLVNEIAEVMETKHNAVVLCSAASLSNLIICEAYKRNPNNTYIDIGSALNPYLNLTNCYASRAYLQHWVLKIPNKYGIQEDVWI